MAVTLTAPSATATVAPSRLRRQVLEKVSRLGRTEHDEIYRILRRHGVPHTQNQNGVFFNLSDVADDTMLELDRFVQYCQSNQRELDEYDKRITECKINSSLGRAASEQPAPAQQGAAGRCLMNVLGESGGPGQRGEPALGATALRSSLAQSERAQAMAGMLEETLQRVQKKPCNKFMLAKKRYARFVRGGAEGGSVPATGGRRASVAADDPGGNVLSEERYTYKGVAPGVA